MTQTLTAALASVFLLAGTALAKPKEIDDYHWSGVERIVAIGDIHGDFDQYLATLEDAGLVDERGRWSGGETHLVQTGDVPDRGPDTRQIMDHLEKLRKEARRKGGRVHTLIGNHDAMMVYGDLRYVTAGEFEAFVDGRSGRLQEAQWEHHLSILEQRDPEAFEAMDLDAFRKDWEKDYPLGWVEHRTAWGARGEYGGIVLNNPVVLKINDTLFVHGGLSAKFCELEVAGYTEQAHEELENYDPRERGLIEDELGPLWYRGLAQDPQAARQAMVDGILARYDAERIVVGHSPTQGVVWPRFGGRVVLNDVGMAAHYGGHFGYLELRNGEAIAHYGEGRALPLPAANEARIAYLEQVIEWKPDNRWLKARLERLQAEGEVAQPLPDPAQLSEEEQAALAQTEAWLSPDNCR